MINRDTIEIIKFEIRYKPVMASELTISKSVKIKSNIVKNELSHVDIISKKIFNVVEMCFFNKEINNTKTPKPEVIQQLIK